jgi:hypothetical protein
MQPLASLAEQAFKARSIIGSHRLMVEFNFSGDSRTLSRPIRRLQDY